MKSALIGLLGAVMMAVAIKFLPLAIVILSVAILFLGVKLLRPLGFYHWLLLRQEKRLAARRAGMSDTQFVHALIEAGADRDVAQWVLEAFQDHYGDSTTANTADRLGSDIGLDDEALEDTVANFFGDMNLSMPSASASEVLPSLEEMTLMSLALFLTQRYAALRSKERIEA